jgi:hypothetical protein
MEQRRLCELRDISETLRMKGGTGEGRTLDFVFRAVEVLEVFSSRCQYEI